MQTMHINLLNFVLAHLAERKVPWTQVARDTGIPYETLKKIASRRTPNPGVLPVQTLADYFSKQFPSSTAPVVAVLSASPKAGTQTTDTADHRTILARRTQIPSPYDHSDIDRRD